jgi:hypothetical protein
VAHDPKARSGWVDPRAPGWILFGRELSLAAAGGCNMKKTFATHVAVAVGITVGLASSAAFAQASTKDDKKDGSYGYEFSDDPLSAGALGPQEASIKVLPRPIRQTLITPRTNFIPEMYKSVENL